MSDINELKLVRQGRLNPSDPRQARIIKAHLAFMSVENPEEYERVKALYEIEEDVEDSVEEVIEEDDNEDASSEDDDIDVDEFVSRLTIEEVNEALEKKGIKVHPATGEEKRRLKLIESLTTQDND